MPEHNDKRDREEDAFSTVTVESAPASHGSEHHKPESYNSDLEAMSASFY